MTHTCRDCGGLFDDARRRVRYCQLCAAVRFKAQKRAYAKRTFSSPFRSVCACGKRFLVGHDGHTKCLACREKRARMLRALVRVGREIVPLRIISGGGGPGTGKDR